MSQDRPFSIDLGQLKSRDKEVSSAAVQRSEQVAEEADDATLDAALRAAMADKPVAQAAKAVAKRYGLDRHQVYARALALKEQV